jgi:hypothetical protein
VTTLLLPDTSEFQAGPSAPDWAGIKKQNGGAGIVRVGYGAVHLDHMFVSNYTALKANKFSFMGLYHYLVGSQDPAAQARQFCSWVGPPSAVAPGTVFICDLEEGSGNQAGRANAWLTTVDKFYGLDTQPLNVRSWLYSGQSFAVATGLTPIFNSARRTWVASYKATEAGLLPHTLWQSTNGTTGANITNWAGCGRVDTSQYNGTLPELAATGWGTPVTPPADQRFHGEYTTAGMFNLADICDKLGYPVNTVLRMTAGHYGTYGDDLGLWLHRVLTGQQPWTTPVPKDVKLWMD